MACAPDRIVSSSYLMLIIGCGPGPRGSSHDPPRPVPSRLRRNIRVPSRDPLLRSPPPLSVSWAPRACCQTGRRASGLVRSRGGTAASCSALGCCAAARQRGPPRRGWVLDGSATASRAWDPAGSPEPVPCARAHQLSQRAVDRCNGNDATRLPTGLI